MHKFMPSIGFHDCSSKSQLDELVDSVLKHPDEELEFTMPDGRKIFQIRKFYTDDLGLSIVGEMNQNGERNVQYAFPYLEGSNLDVEEEIQLQKFAEKDAYAGISENMKLGISLIFYLNNMVSMLIHQNRHPGYEYKLVELSALSREGMIIFGVEQSDDQRRRDYRGRRSRRKMMESARNGDKEAMQNLTIRDIDTYTKISRRSQNEDIYSIVSTSFCPYGVETDQYSILGEIRSVDLEENSSTGEMIYVLGIRCNDLDFKVAINALDLYGVPEIGRRFKGNIWLQGSLKI